MRPCKTSGCPETLPPDASPQRKYCDLCRLSRDAERQRETRSCTRWWWDDQQHLWLIRGHDPRPRHCKRCGVYCLPSRRMEDAGIPEGSVKRDTKRIRGILWGNWRAGTRQLVTRLRKDPRPEHAPRAKDFQRADGTELYRDSRTLKQLNPLPRVVPPGCHRYWKGRPLTSELTNVGGEEAWRAGGENPYTAVWDSPDARDRDIFRWRDLRDRGIKVEELPAEREWREWQARPRPVPETPKLKPPVPRGRVKLMLPRPRKDGDKRVPLKPDLERCGCGWLIVPKTAAICRRCKGSGEVREREVAKLKVHVVEARDEVELDPETERAA